MSIDLLYDLMTAMDTDDNTILGIDSDKRTIDNALLELDKETQNELRTLFIKIINNMNTKKEGTS